MGAAGTSYVTGWNGYKITGNGSMPNGTFITGSSDPSFQVSNGSSGEATVYNYGSTGASDRALGSTASTTTTPGFGVVLVNDTGRVLTAIDVLVEFRAEQWRAGANQNDDEVLQFEWRTGNATLDVNDPSSVGWSTASGLNLNEIRTESGGTDALDGNAAGNFVDISGSMAGLVWNPGNRLVLRWLDANNSGEDAGMAVDRFTFWVFAQVPEPSTWAMYGAAVLCSFAFLRRTKRKPGPAAVVA